MQGVIFTVLCDCVTENFGLDVWNELIDQVDPHSKGIYTSSANYSDEELFGLVVTLSEKVNVPVNDLVKTFGEYMFPHLIAHMPEAHQQDMTFRDFMLSIDHVIHKEVERLYPDAYLPSIDFIQSTEGLTMHYRSKRKLCLLAEGLTLGAAHYFKTEITLEHPVCMHEGAEHCEIVIKYV